MRWRAWIGAVAALLGAAPAAAEWQQATTRHFMVMADGTRADVTQMATRLEQVDQLARVLFATADKDETAANKVTVYVLPSITQVQKLCGKCGSVAGYYMGRADGSVAYTAAHDDGGISSQVVLFHEYGHHFLLGGYAMAYPAWFSEGFAEFLSTTQFAKDYIEIGAPAAHRAYGLFNLRQLPAAQLFAPPARMTDEQTESLYGKGWLLTHYLLLDPAHGRQFKQYLLAINEGVPSVKAAEQAFGDLKALDKALDRYLDGKLQAFRAPYSKLKPVTVDVRALTPGERALIQLRIQSEHGVTHDEAVPLLARATRAAAPFAGDAGAQGWLAEMAYDAGDDAAAEAAADRALKADPRSMQALLYKGRVHLRRAAAAHADAKAWAEARGWLIRANRLDNNNAEALELFYESFGEASQPPPVSAVDGLYRAQQLVPQDAGLRFETFRQALIDNQVPLAKALLRPLAYDPHQGSDNQAAKWMGMLDQPDGAKATLAAMTAPAPAKPAPGAAAKPN